MVNATADSINAVFEGIISLTVIIGGGFLAFTHPDNTAIMTFVGASVSIVMTFWFSQRSVAKVQNGSLTALSNLATQIGSAQAQAKEGQVPAPSLILPPK